MMPIFFTINFATGAHSNLVIIPNFKFKNNMIRLIYGPRQVKRVFCGQEVLFPWKQNQRIR